MRGLGEEEEEGEEREQERGGGGDEVEAVHSSDPLCMYVCLYVPVFIITF